MPQRGRLCGKASAWVLRGQKGFPPHDQGGKDCVPGLVERGGFEPPTSRLQAGKRGKKDDSANATTFRTFALEGHFSL